MENSIIICGSGGQGILLSASLLAYAGVLEKKNVTWLPSYGAEKRGGLSFCVVCISDQEISSPVVDKADVIIALDNIGLQVYENAVKDNGLMIVNSSLIKRDIITKSEIMKVPLNDLANELGNPRVLNVISAGVYLGKKKVLKLDSVFSALEKVISKRHAAMIEVNRKAIEKGYKIGEGKE